MIYTIIAASLLMVFSVLIAIDVYVLNWPSPIYYTFPNLPRTILPHFDDPSGAAILQLALIAVLISMVVCIFVIRDFRLPTKISGTFALLCFPLLVALKCDLEDWRIFVYITAFLLVIIFASIDLHRLNKITAGVNLEKTSNQENSHT